MTDKKQPEMMILSVILITLQATVPFVWVRVAPNVGSPRGWDTTLRFIYSLNSRHLF